MNLQPKYKLLPYPYKSALLFAIWLLLTNSVEPFHILVAAFLAVLIPLLTVRCFSPQPAITHPLLCLRYLFRLAFDIIRANFQVARLILGSQKHLHPGFICLPLDLRHELPITILASTLSLTPGTVSAKVYPAMEPEQQNAEEIEHWLVVHVLDLKNEASLIQQIKERYESPLKEIFGC